MSASSVHSPLRALVAPALLTVADGVALVRLPVPSPSAAFAHLRAPHSWLASTGTDQAALHAAAGLAWVIAAWLALGLSATVATRLPGHVGRVADAIARHLLPAALYRMAAGAAGLGIVLTPALGVVGTGAASASAPPVAVAVAPTPAWPSSAPSPTSSVEAPRWPTSARPNGSVVVRPGDTLWSIAAEHLPPHAPDSRIAAEWPRWFAANHRVIGSDPDHLEPGEHLHIPPTPHRSKETS